ncbi:MAG: hypothetical protein JNK37_12530 [Verrucomicrobiales bacterium]|nr:hypothetical protein [Verrucomicrobiales bacterium]
MKAFVNFPTTLAALFFLPFCSTSKTSPILIAISQARQFQASLAHFRDRNEGAFPKSINDLESFSKEVLKEDLSSKWVLYGNHIKSSYIWVYIQPGSHAMPNSVVFWSPEPVEGSVIVGFADGDIEVIKDVTTRSLNR